MIEPTKIQPVKWVLEGLRLPTNKLKLFSDVGFFYEIKLAKMELSTWQEMLKEFVKRAAYFEEIDGKKTYHYHISSIRGKGQIGHSNQYLTHWFYPYKAKFHPQMIKALVNWMGLKRGDTLLDPFVGSGTALIEAKTLGIKSIGIDINPICLLQAKVKTDLLDMKPSELLTLPKRQIFNFFEEKRASVGLKNFGLLNTTKKDNLIDDSRLYDFYLLCYLYALSDYTYIKKNLWGAFSTNFDSILETIRRWEELKKSLNLELGEVEVKEDDARDLEQDDESVNGIITSPPYSIAVDYIQNDLHALRYLKIDPEKLRENMIGLRGVGQKRIDYYNQDMKVCFEEMHRVLKSGSYCIIVIGDASYAGRRLDTHRKFIEFGKDVGFEFIDIIKRPILGGYARLRYEYILIFQKR